VSGHFFADAASGLGKRERTRAALLDAAVDVVGRKGMEAAKITDMTAAAGLANGTFYNYFQTKEEILHRVAVDVAVEVSERLNAQMSGIDDGPTRVVTATHSFVELILESPDWANILLDGWDYLPNPPLQTFRYLRADLSQGVEQGAFDVEVDPFTIAQVVALIGSAIRLQLAAGRDPEITKRLCVNVLRLLGVAPRKAGSTVSKALG